MWMVQYWRKQAAVASGWPVPKAACKVITGGGSVELLKVGAERAGGDRSRCNHGAIRCRARINSRTRCCIRHAGDVIVYLPPSLGVSVHASTELAYGKGITSVFPGVTITSEGGNYGPKSMYGEGQLNGGGPILRIRTTIGQIDIRRLQQ